VTVPTVERGLREVVFCSMEMAGHVAALALGVDGVEGQRRLARARQAGEHHQPVARDFDVHALEIVLARATDRDRAAVVGAGLRRGCAGAPALVEKVVHEA
jgi:hypothetical protein